MGYNSPATTDVPIDGLQGLLGKLRHIEEQLNSVENRIAAIGDLIHGGAPMDNSKVAPTPIRENLDGLLYSVQQQINVLFQRLDFIDHGRSK